MKNMNETAPNSNPCAFLVLS